MTGPARGNRELAAFGYPHRTRSRPASREGRIAREPDGYYSVNTIAMRRSLVLTDEAARHPFRASLPPHVRRENTAAHDDAFWRVTAQDMRGVVTTYFACLAAVLAFIL